MAEPAPRKNDRDFVAPAVIQDMEARMQHGIDTYGVALQPHNGRRAMQDLYEELLDAVVYAKQYLIEEHVPMRGSVVEKWIKNFRDIYIINGPYWCALDDLLDEYQLHADTGTPLDEGVSDGGREE